MSPLSAELPPVAGPVRILSDPHLGHDMSTVRTVASLRPLIAGAGRVIFNGDTLQERAGAFRERSAAMVAELREMCQADSVEVVFLRGNHDPTAWPLEMVDLPEDRVKLRSLSGNSLRAAACCYSVTRTVPMSGGGAGGCSSIPAPSLLFRFRGWWRLMRAWSPHGVWLSREAVGKNSACW